MHADNNNSYIVLVIIKYDYFTGNKYWILKFYIYVT